MPRISNKRRALQDIDDTAEVIAGCIILSKSNDKKYLWRNLETLVKMHSMIESHRYFSRGTNSAGRHDTDIIDNIIYEFSEDRLSIFFL